MQLSPQPSFRMAPSPKKISSAHWQLNFPKFCKISRCPAVRKGEGGSGRGKEFQEGRAQRHGWTWYIWGNASSSIRLEPRVCGDGLRGGSLGRAVGQVSGSEFGVARRDQTMESLAFPAKELGGFLY